MAEKYTVLVPLKDIKEVASMLTTEYDLALDDWNKHLARENWVHRMTLAHISDFTKFESKLDYDRNLESLSLESLLTRMNTIEVLQEKLTRVAADATDIIIYLQCLLACGAECHAIITGITPPSRTTIGSCILYPISDRLAMFRHRRDNPVCRVISRKKRDRGEGPSSSCPLHKCDLGLEVRTRKSMYHLTENTISKGEEEKESTITEGPYERPEPKPLQLTMIASCKVKFKTLSTVFSSGWQPSGKIKHLLDFLCSGNPSSDYRRISPLGDYLYEVFPWKKVSERNTPIVEYESEFSSFFVDQLCKTLKRPELRKGGLDPYKYSKLEPHPMPEMNRAVPSMVDSTDLPRRIFFGQGGLPLIVDDPLGFRVYPLQSTGPMTSGFYQKFSYLDDKIAEVGEAFRCSHFPLISKRMAPNSFDDAGKMILGKGTSRMPPPVIACDNMYFRTNAANSNIYVGYHRSIDQISYVRLNASCLSQKLLTGREHPEYLPGEVIGNTAAADPPDPRMMMASETVPENHQVKIFLKASLLEVDGPHQRDRCEIPEHSRFLMSHDEQYVLLESKTSSKSDLPSVYLEFPSEDYSLYMIEKSIWRDSCNPEVNWWKGYPEEIYVDRYESQEGPPVSTDWKCGGQHFRPFSPCHLYSVILKYARKSLSLLIHDMRFVGTDPFSRPSPAVDNILRSLEHLSDDHQFCSKPRPTPLPTDTAKVADSPVTIRCLKSEDLTVVLEYMIKIDRELKSLWSKPGFALSLFRDYTVCDLRRMASTV